MSQHDEFITWARGRTDALGLPFSDWLVSVEGPDGRLKHDADGRVIYETQAEYLARQNTTSRPRATLDQLELFA